MCNLDQACGSDKLLKAMTQLLYKYKFLRYIIFTD